MYFYLLHSIVQIVEILFRFRPDPWVSQFWSKTALNHDFNSFLTDGPSDGGTHPLIEMRKSKNISGDFFLNTEYLPNQHPFNSKKILYLTSSATCSSHKTNLNNLATNKKFIFSLAYGSFDLSFCFINRRIHFISHKSFESILLSFALFALCPTLIGVRFCSVSLLFYLIFFKP